MKCIEKISFWTLLLAVISISPAMGQRSYKSIKGNGQVVRSSQALPQFTRLKASGTDHIYILTKDNQPYSLVVETDKNLLDYIQAAVVDHTLSFKYKNLKPTRLNFYVTVPSLEAITVMGAADVNSIDTLKGSILDLNTSGAADVKLLLDYQKIKLVASGAADIHLVGVSEILDAHASGAADVKAAKLTVDSVFAKASGASNLRVNAIKYLNKNVSGVADVQLVNSRQKLLTIKTRQNAPLVRVYGNNRVSVSDDTTRVDVGSLHVEVIDGDTTKVSVGGHTLVVDDHGNVKWQRNSRPRFNGHWGGVELGINGYVNTDGNADFPPRYDFMSLQYEKSSNVNLNLFEQNIPLNKARTIGVITGLGLSFYNYRFTEPVYLATGLNDFSGYFIKNVSVKKSKLSVYYVSVPFILEFQTENNKRRHRFHLGMGVILNARIRSFSKIYFNEANKQYFLEDPVTKTQQPEYYTTPNRSSRNIVKSVNSFNLNPFLVNGTLRLGYGNLSLFANVGLTPMFQEAKGPKLYQWSAGITVVPW